MSRQRLECVELAPALVRLSQTESAGKLDALDIWAGQGTRAVTATSLANGHFT